MKRCHIKTLIVILLVVVLVAAVCVGVRRSTRETATKSSHRTEQTQPELDPMTTAQLPTATATPATPSGTSRVSSAPQQQIGQKVDSAFRGDVQARHDLMAVAADGHAGIADREIAIRYLGKEGKPDSLVIVAQQLISPDPGIRTTAFYSLPSKLRPEGYDYTAEPTDASISVVTQLVDQIRK